MNPAVKNHPIRSFALLCLFVISAGASHVSLASGGGSSGGFYDDTPEVVDYTYEAGKAIFKGRNQSYPSQTFCISDVNTGKVSKIKRKTIKPFKRKPARNLANSLYSCQEPSQRASSILQGDDISFLIYYLNKRFSLRLKR